MTTKHGMIMISILTVAFLPTLANSASESAANDIGIVALLSSLRRSSSTKISSVCALAMVFFSEAGHCERNRMIKWVLDTR